jgi:hypothetical protein
MVQMVDIEARGSLYEHLFITLLKWGLDHIQDQIARWLRCVT